MKKSRLFNLTLLLVAVLFAQDSLAQTTLEGHEWGVTSVAFSPDGKILAVGSDYGMVKLWDMATSANTATFEAHIYGVESIAFSPDGKTPLPLNLYSIELWDVATSTNVAAERPNPFNSQTIISYFLPKSGLTRLEVFSVTGQRVAVLRQGNQQAGYHRLHWNGLDREGHPLASGMYLYRLVTEEDILTRKLTLLR